MDTSIHPVDYDNHPVFSTGMSSWTCSQDLIDEFTLHYDQLKKGTAESASDLQRLTEAIKVDLLAQTENDNERAFVEEVFNDVEKQIENHATFYRLTKINRDKISELNKRQSDLIERGFYVTQISKSALKKILRVSANSLEQLQKNAEYGRTGRQDLSINSGLVILKIVNILNHDFKKSGVLKSLNSISTGKYKVVGVSLELSVAGSSWWKPKFDAMNPPKTLYAHVDREVSAPKSIVYLTDVALDNGPTSCYPGAYQNLRINGLQDFIGRSWENIGRLEDSPLRRIYRFEGPVMDSEAFRNHFMKLPSNLRFNSHFGWDVIPDSELEDYLASSESFILGPAGTALVFDGARLLHRGGLITKNQRVVLQVVFGRSTMINRARQAMRFVKRLVSSRK